MEGLETSQMLIRSIHSVRPIRPNGAVLLFPTTSTANLIDPIWFSGLGTTILGGEGRSNVVTWCLVSGVWCLWCVCAHVAKTRPTFDANHHSSRLGKEILTRRPTRMLMLSYYLIVDPSVMIQHWLSKLVVHHHSTLTGACPATEPTGATRGSQSHSTQGRPIDHFS
jgi:hypothetical protein